MDDLGFWDGVLLVLIISFIRLFFSWCINNGKMEKRKALEIAIDIIKGKIREINVLADIYDVQHLDWTTSKGASKRRMELQMVIKILKEIGYG